MSQIKELLLDISKKYWGFLSIYCRYQRSNICTYIRRGIHKKSCEFDNCPVWPKE